MVEPSRRNSRRALAGGVAAAIALAAGGFALGRNSGARPEPAVAPSPLPSPAATAVAPTVPVVAPALGRADLLAGAQASADAFAAGLPLPPQVAALDGRRFELRLPFGCGGRSPEEASLGWRYDTRAGALRVRVTPPRFDPAEWLAPADAAEVDAAEGFWIERPWTTNEACPPASGDTPLPSPSPSGFASGDGKTPAVTPPPAFVPPPERTLALVQFHGADESRVGRRDGAAYEAVEKVAVSGLDVSQGLRLRLSGRVTGAPGGGGPVLCHAPAGAGTRPVCLVSVSLDEIAIENPATDTTLATWDVARSRGGKD